MLQRIIALTMLIPVLAILSACGPAGYFTVKSEGQMPTPVFSFQTVAPDATAVPVTTSTATPSPLATDTRPVPEPIVLAATATTVPATATRPPTLAPVPAANAPVTAWKSFTSYKYHYVIAYPYDWTVTVENPGTVGEAREAERVVFRQPGDTNPNEFASVTIDAAQRGFTTTGQCQNMTEVVPGIRGCRRSMPRGQDLAQELVWFHPADAGDTQPYFYVRLVYDDLKNVTTFNRMLTTFKYTGLPVTVTPPNPGECTYRAAFVADVTVPDNTVLAPGTRFTKTWRLRNDGTCTWGYAGSALHRLVFVGGDPLGAPTAIELPIPQLGQGGTVDIAVPMVAPLNEGTYTTNWRLQVDNGPQVGVGPNGDTPLYARIIVRRPATPTAMPPPGSKSYTSNKYHYVVSYPANWSINVQSGAPAGMGVDPEYVYLRRAATGLPTVEILALKGAPPITGYENCVKNLIFRGVQACSISKPQGGQIPPTQLLVFQKGAAHFQLSMEYDNQQQLGVFDDIVRSFQFTQ